ncbi:MAG: sigma-54 dependent transcriptional regulator [Bacteroidota bacterium]
MSLPSHILIIDDDETVCSSLRLLLTRAGHEVETTFDPRSAMRRIGKKRPDLVILDMNFTIDTSGRQGLRTLKEIQSIDSSIPVILITGWGTLQLAVKGMKAGARDFLTKPWDNKMLLNSVHTLLQLDAVNNQEEQGTRFSNIIGQDSGFLAILQTAQRVSKTNASVLILGESGTGKELLAEAIHYESTRANNPFVKVNLGGISSTLFESEMFGHKKGAFTGAISDRVGRFDRADFGTIFLDEIGDLDMSCQVKLLRVLQEKTFEVLGSSQPRKVDVRVISATNKNLENMVIQGSFREDLFYRINLISLQLPALRERKSDIPLLVEFYVNNLKDIYQRPTLSVSKHALNWLEEQHFPGNIRQLKNLVERTVLVSPGERLEKEDFARQFRARSQQTQTINLPEVGEISLEEMEKQMIEKALTYHQRKITPTAHSLGITRSALYRRLSKYEIPYDA